MSETSAETTSSPTPSKPDCASCPMASSDGDSGGDKDSKGGKDSKGAGRGERQKLVTQRYRSNWDSIFGKKRR
ncbi:MAG TPA: hypothetical protein QGF63_15790 [Alphaproteobacteria bacterium]|jgi:hypothetical protein|nr:hypothetical protein [Alphaproteobacteria bacterium]HJM51292.1 hypothetical protein [Alphaproteobacteria bacterium]|tara:strand:+ start:647 stop:865 length:219 start_codon:yes stop_codon:yes gene_type:complete